MNLVMGYIGNYWENGTENGNYYVGLYGVLNIYIYIYVYVYIYI